MDGSTKPGQLQTTPAPQARSRTIDAVTAAIIDTVLAVNVRAPFLLIREAVKRMATDLGGAGGAIVNISSRAAELGGAGEWIHYAASKGALDSLTIGASRGTRAARHPRQRRQPGPDPDRSARSRRCP